MIHYIPSQEHKYSNNKLGINKHNKVGLHYKGESKSSTKTICIFILLLILIDWFTRTPTSCREYSIWRIFSEITRQFSVLKDR